MNGMEGIFGIIGIGAGLYSLYAWFQLKFKGIINTSILVPKDTNIKKCKDKEAYRAAAGPKLLVLAVVLILYGAEDLYNTYVQSTGKLFWVMLVLVLAVLVWFAWTVKREGADKKSCTFLFHLAEKFVTIKVLHGRENVMGIKENVMREMKCRKIPIRFRMEPY